MKRGEKRALYLLLLVFAIVLVACGGSGIDQTETAPEEDSSESTPLAVLDEAVTDSEEEGSGESIAPEEFDLPETYDFGRFGFSIAHPAGWLASTQEPVTFISELQSDHDVAFNDDQSKLEGYQVLLDHRSMAFMRSIGFGDEQAIDALFELNKDFFDWQEPIETEESEVFGVPALAVKATDGVNWGYALMGFVNDEAFLLSIAAPTEEDLDEIMPTWKAMVASIEPSDG